ncbi:MAG TPA: 30S ribosomal protein S17 [Candidatus Angelobacter sp.]|jgi:small subunit ribosomal protein S17|nr:30S ribosomal protein S17 [Candidatus Angelobacter sp.]
MKRNSRKERIGIVLKNRMNKTIIVYDEKRINHPRYGKGLFKTKKYTVHDEENIANKDDIVRIMETRPLSKKKRWRLIKIEKKCFNKNLDLE